jgi:hypothetical protein
MSSALSTPLIPVPFLGATIFVTDEVEPRVPLRPIVEALGLSWAAQTEKLNSDKKGWGVSMIETPSAGGIQAMLAIPLRRLFAWLRGIKASKVKPEVRSRLERYHEECDRVLEQHWTRTRAGLPVPLAPGEEPSGNLLVSLYGPTRGMGDPEAERLAIIAARAKEAGAPFRSEESAAKRSIAKLGYDKLEIAMLVARAKRALQEAMAATQPLLPFKEG